MRIVSPASIVSFRTLGVSSFIFGISLFLPLLVLIPISPYLIDPVAAVPTPATIAYTYCFLAFTFLIGPTLGMITFRAQLADMTRETFAIFWAAAGVLSLAYLISVVSFLEDYGAGEFFKTLGIHWGLLLGWSVVAMCIRPMIAWLWPFKLQDGASCPQCGYCVRGVSSRICPECGEPFNRADLGLTEAEFDALLCVGQAESPTAAST